MIALKSVFMFTLVRLWPYIAAFALLMLVRG